MSDDFRTSACRVSAPMTSVSPLTEIPRNSLRSLMSTISSGATSRRFIAGIRLCPPDSTFALSPCKTSSSSALATLVARA
jgi:hypothetical protein